MGGACATVSLVCRSKVLGDDCTASPVTTGRSHREALARTCSTACCPFEGRDHQSRTAGGAFMRHAKACPDFTRTSHPRFASKKKKKKKKKKFPAFIPPFKKKKKKK